MDHQEVELMGMAWFDLAYDRDRWRALVNVVMNFQVPQNVRSFFNPLPALT
jgi:transposase